MNLANLESAETIFSDRKQTYRCNKFTHEKQRSPNEQRMTLHRIVYWKKDCKEQSVLLGRIYHRWVKPTDTVV